jgi:N-acetylglucosamine-6-phosphate deacetylase
MATLNPAEFLGIAHDTGRIRAGYRANLVLADDDLNVLETWIDGQPSQAARTETA